MAQFVVIGAGEYVNPDNVTRLVEIDKHRTEIYFIGGGDVRIVHRPIKVVVEALNAPPAEVHMHTNNYYSGGRGEA